MFENYKNLIGWFQNRKQDQIQSPRWNFPPSNEMINLPVICRKSLKNVHLESVQHQGESTEIVIV